VRMQLLSTMVIVKQIDVDLKDYITAAQKANLPIIYDKFIVHVDRKITYIESFDMSLLKLDKMKVDTERSIVLTLKA